MKLRWLAAAVLVLGTVAAALWPRPDAAAESRRRARQLFARAEAAYLNGHGEQAFDFLIASLAADPEYTPALWSLYRSPPVRGMWSAVQPRLDALLSTFGDRDLADCARKLLLLSQEIQQPLQNSHPDGTGARECVDIYRLNLPQDGARRSADSVRQLVNAAIRLRARYPESVHPLELILSGAVGGPDLAARMTQARDVAERAADPRYRAAAFVALARGLRQQGRDSAAQVVESQALASLRNAPFIVRAVYLLSTGRRNQIDLDSVRQWPDRIMRFELLILLGVSAYSDGDLALSHDIWDELVRESGDLADVRANALHYRGRTHLKAGELAPAEADLRAAERYALQSDNAVVLIEVAHNLFHIYEAQNRPEPARAAARLFIERAQWSALLSRRMIAYHDLGWYQWRLGEYGAAQAVLGRMLALIDTLGRSRHFAGEYYERIGDLESALRWYAAADAEEADDARSIGRRALLASLLGDSVRAIRLARAHDMRLRPNYPEFTPLLPEVLATFGMRAAALQAALDAQLIAQQRKQAAAIAGLQLQRAQLSLELGQPRSARVLADSAARVAQSVAAFETEINARGVNILSSALLTRSGGEVHRLRQLTRQPGVTRAPQLRISLLKLVGDAEAALGDTRAALDAYGAAEQLNDSLAARLDNDADRASLRSARNDVSGRALSAVLHQQPTNVAELYLTWSGRRKARGVAETRPTDRPDVPHTHLSAHEAVLDYVVLDTLVAALLITRTRTVVRVLPVSATELQTEVRLLNDQLAPRIGTMIDASRSRFDVRLAHALYRQLLRPFETELRDVDRLTIVADRVLHYLSFEALVRDTAGARPGYVLERFAVQYAPSVALLHNGKHARYVDVAAFAGHAPEAAQELRAIAAHGRKLHVSTVPADSATERRVQRMASTASILHFATHASPNDVTPLFAYLGLKRDAASDGRLHAFEIEQLKLPGSLIVLSGCDTGSGRLAGGEGVLSLSRVFLRAGASGTIATLWPVGAGTADFMSDFYGALAKGMSADAALRHAKLQALSGGRASPFFWAPFVLIST